MKHKSWTFLKAGDIVDVIAPASNSPSQKIEDGMAWLTESKLVPRIPDNLIQTDLFFSAPLPVQLEHLKEALYSDSKAIWCLRGGYGSMRLIPHLLKLTPPKKPKFFIGFSDITALHLFFSQNWKWPVIHGRTISQLSPAVSKTPDRLFLTEMMYGKKTDKTFKLLTPMNNHARKDKNLNAPITGGNLRIVQSSLGSSWELKAKGKILFLEDVSERGYSIDRMLEQLIQAKIIDQGIKAIVFGDFTEGIEKDGRDLTLNALERFADKVPYPVLRGLPAGHGDQNWPIPFGTNCSLRLGNKPELSCFYGGTGPV